jgi:transcriptional regulator of acetoin/glycerol metabolism
VLDLRTSVLHGPDARRQGSVVVFRDATELVGLKEELERLHRLHDVAGAAAATVVALAPAEDEREMLRRTLQSTGWNVAKAARRLNISRTTLYERIDRYALSRPKE